MYSSIETPLSLEQQQQHHHHHRSINKYQQQYQYHHRDAFNSQHATASAVSTFLSSSSPSIPSILATHGMRATVAAAKSSECVKSIITPSSETHELHQQQQQPSTLFNNNNNNDRNKFSYGAYSHNNNNDVKYSKSFNYRTTTMVNDKIKMRGPYLQYKLSERDNNGNYRKLDHFSDSPLDGGVQQQQRCTTTILPRAKILSNSVLDASGVDYNLRTQTIGRYNPPKPTANIVATSEFHRLLRAQRAEGEHGYSSHTLPSMRRAHKSHQPPPPQHTPSYITLDSALSFDFFNHLTPTQGWALLCQSIQALQDLFLSEPPSINRIMPVITPGNFMLTSRGRVVYGLLSIDKYNECVNEFISDEFHQFVAGRKMNYNESDVEKMWIFSLGRSLMKTLPRTATATSMKAMQSVQNQCAVVLQATIYKMCNFNVNERASLMFLLNIISDYCKNVHQSKPFSHIIMDLFKRVTQGIAFPTLTEGEEKEIKDDACNIESSKDDIRSDTDSGRSSDYRDDNPLMSKPLSLELEASKYFSLPRPKYTPKPEVAPPVKMRATAAENRGARGGRRFTVDVSSNDVATALADIGIKRTAVAAVSRSHTNLHAIDEGEMKISTLPNMKLRKEAPKEREERREPTGPEFIVHSQQHAKLIDITDSKCLNKGIVKVLLLNGKVYDIICDSISTTALKIFNAIIRHEQMHENYILGLCALIGGDFVFLPMDLKVYKVAPQLWIQSASRKTQSESVAFTLYLRIKFFLPTLRMLSLESRHTLYLQLRKSVLENHIICTDDDLITLGGLALQAEVGDFQEEMKYVEYFTISHYLPDGVYQQQKELARYLRNSHYSKRGLHPTEAEHNFIRYLQRMKEYGIHYMSAVWTRDDKIELNVYIGIGLNGITIFERYANNDLAMHAKRNRDARKCNKRLLYEQFDWLEIENLCFSKQIFCIVVRKLNINGSSKSNKDRIKFKLKMDSRKSFFAFSIASEHHKFYIKLKNSFMSIKSIADEMNISLSNADGAHSAELNIKIDKVTKTSGPRVRNLKKSVLNDTRLMRLKDRFLRRSKSTVSDLKRHMEQTANENNLNREVERPQYPSMIDLSVRSPTTRNKVKMGTRVFSSSSQLNKSFESLSENYQEMFHVDSWGALHLKHTLDEEEDGGVANEAQSEENNEAVVLHSSIKSSHHGGSSSFAMPNESTVLSSSLAEKFENLSCTGSSDRILSQVKVVKCPVFSEHLSYKSQSLRDLAFSSNVDSYITGYSMGISIIQGQTDNYVYVKEIIKSGPGDKAGIRIGDQIISVDGVSLLNLPYEQSLEILQHTGNEVNLIVSQVFNRKATMRVVHHEEHSMNNSNFNNDNRSNNNTDICKDTTSHGEMPTNLTVTPSKSLPNLKNIEDYQLPKIVAIIPKGSINIDIPNLVAKPPRALGQSRKYTGPLKFPVTPAKRDKDLKLTVSPVTHKTHLSLASESDSLII